MRQLDQAVQRGGPGIEGCRPGIHVRHVLETARQRLEQLRLLARRAKEDAMFVHACILSLIMVRATPRTWRRHQPWRWVCPSFIVGRDCAVGGASVEQHYPACD